MDKRLTRLPDDQKLIGVSPLLFNVIMPLKRCPIIMYIKGDKEQKLFL